MEPENKKARIGMSNEQTNICDLNEYVLLEVFQHCDLPKLLELADVNREFRRVSGIAFLRLRKKVSLSTVSDELKLVGFGHVSLGKDVWKKFFRLFGSQIEQLCIFPMKREMVPLALMSEKCSSLKSLDLVGLTIAADDIQLWQNLIRSVSYLDVNICTFTGGADVSRLLSALNTLERLNLTELARHPIKFTSIMTIQINCLTLRKVTIDDELIRNLQPTLNKVKEMKIIDCKLKESVGFNEFLSELQLVNSIEISGEIELTKCLKWPEIKSMNLARTSASTKAKETYGYLLSENVSLEKIILPEKSNRNVFETVEQKLINLVEIQLYCDSKGNAELDWNQFPNLKFIVINFKIVPPLSVMRAVAPIQLKSVKLYSDYYQRDSINELKAAILGIRSVEHYTLSCGMTDEDIIEIVQSAENINSLSIVGMKNYKVQEIVKITSCNAQLESLDCNTVFETGSLLVVHSPLVQFTVST